MGAAEWGTSMQKVIAYQDRAEEWRRRASEAGSDGTEPDATTVHLASRGQLLVSLCQPLKPVRDAKLPRGSNARLLPACD